MTSGSSRGRPAKLTSPTAYKFKTFGNPKKSSEVIIDLTAPKKRPHPVASPLVDNPNIPSCSGRPDFASIDKQSLLASQFDKHALHKATRSYYLSVK